MARCDRGRQAAGSGAARTRPQTVLEIFERNRLWNLPRAGRRRNSGRTRPSQDGVGGDAAQSGNDDPDDDDKRGPVGQDRRWNVPWLSQTKTRGRNRDLGSESNTTGAPQADLETNRLHRAGHEVAASTGFS